MHFIRGKIKQWEGDFPWIRIQSQKVRTSGGQLKFAISVREQNGAVSKDTHLLQQTRPGRRKAVPRPTMRLHYNCNGPESPLHIAGRTHEILWLYKSQRKATQKTVEREEIRWTNPITRTKNTEYITKKQETSEKPGEGGRREKNQWHSKKKTKNRDRNREGENLALASQHTFAIVSSSSSSTRETLRETGRTREEKRNQAKKSKTRGEAHKEQRQRVRK